MQPALDELAPKNRVLPHTPPDLRPGLGAQLRERVRANAERLQRVRKQGQDLTRLGLADKEAANQKLQASLQRTIKVGWKFSMEKGLITERANRCMQLFFSCSPVACKAAGACGLGGILQAMPGSAQFSGPALRKCQAETRSNTDV